MTWHMNYLTNQNLIQRKSASVPSHLSSFSSAWQNKLTKYVNISGQVSRDKIIYLTLTNAYRYMISQIFKFMWKALHSILRQIYTQKICSNFQQNAGKRTTMQPITNRIIPHALYESV